MIKGHFYRRLAANALLCCLCAGSLLVASDAQGRSIRWLPLGYGLPRSVADNGTVVFSDGVLLPEGTYLRAPHDMFSGWTTLYDGSADGRTFVGYQERGWGTAWPILWRPPGDVVRLVPWAQSGVASCVSLDGSTVVGVARVNSNQPSAVFLSRKGEESLVLLSQPERASPYAASSDGSVFVGQLSSYRGYAAFVCESGIIRELPSWGGRFNGARSVSADGSVIVGFATTTWVGTWDYYDYWRAAAWINGRLIDVGSLDRQESEALDVSGDGRFVVGSAWDRYYYQEGYRWRYWKWNYIAFVWTPDSGIRPLQEVFGDLLANGSLLLTADAISPNGRYILGTGYDASSQRSSPFLIDTW